MADTAVLAAERTLPHNLEAERSVLGAILVHNDAFNLAAQVIDTLHEPASTLLQTQVRADWTTAETRCCTTLLHPMSHSKSTGATCPARRTAELMRYR